MTLILSDLPYSHDPLSANGIFNNVSQHLNHEQFWQMMSPLNINMPSELEKALSISFGSV